MDIINGFVVYAPVSIDDRLVKDTIVDRDAIPLIYRYLGLPVYVVETELSYRLVGGITNSDWVASGAVDAYTKGETDTAIANAIAALHWKTSVATFSDIATTYPTPTVGWCVIANDTGVIYHYRSGSWQSAGVSAVELAGKIDVITTGVLGNVPMRTANGNLEDSGVPATDIVRLTVHRGLANGVASLNADGVIPVAQIPGAAIPFKIVPDIPARNALTEEEYTNKVIHVIDASGDVPPVAGSAGYWYDPELYVWVKTYEGVNNDISLEWASILNGPASTPAQIDSAVGDAHNQNEDTILADGTADEVSAHDIRSHIDDTNNPHGVTKAQLGLTNVEDKSSAQIRAEIVDSDLPVTITRDTELAQAIQDIKGTPTTLDTIEKLEDAIGAVGTPGLAAAIEVTVDYLPGVEVGDTYPIGTGFEDILRDLLAPYVSHVLNSLTITFSPNDAYFEAGDTVDIISASLVYTPDSDDSFPYDGYVAGEGFAKAMPSTPLAANVGATAVVAGAGSKVWTVTANDKNTSPLDPKTFTKYWRLRYWFGANATAIPTGDVSATALALSLSQSQLLDSKTASFLASSDNNTTGNYTWIVYPASFGALARVLQDGAVSVLGAFTYVGSFNVTNAYGVVTSYRFYRSNADKAFSSGTVLAIS